MKLNITEMILKRIRKNAERGAGLASEKGVYEPVVPEKLKRKSKQRNCEK